MMNLKQRFDEMMAEGLEEEIRAVAEESDISNAATAPILPVIAKLDTTEPFIAGAFLLGQNSMGEPELILTEPSEDDPDLPSQELVSWINSTMAMEGITDCDSVAELLLDFNRAVVATQKDFSDADLMGWDYVFTEIRNYRRSTNRRSLRQIAGSGAIQNLLVDVLKSMMRDFAVNLDAFIEEAETVELQSEGDELGFSDDFQEEWE
jgi:hypothetical protein